MLVKQKEIFLNGGVLPDDTTQKQIPGAVANGVSREIASELFEQILKFANYAFNKSHAAAYAVLAYQTAWLKCYYPTHFITAVINNRITNADEVKHYINYLRRVGVKILAPDINRSKKVFSIENDNVRYGLMGIKNVGEQAMEFVLGERERGGKFSDLRDFIERCAGQVNKRMIESLIKGGAFDCFGKTRSTLMASYERIMDAVNADKKNKLEGQMSLFDDLVEDVTVKYTELAEYDKMQLLAGEKEVLGMYVSGHPLDDYKDTKHEFDFETSMLFTKEYDDNGDEISVLNKELSGKSVRMGCIVESHERKMTGKQQKFAVGRLEDREGTVEFSMYPRAYEQYGALLEADVPVKAYGKIDLRDESEPKSASKAGTLGERSRAFRASRDAFRCGVRAGGRLRNDQAHHGSACDVPRRSARARADEGSGRQNVPQRVPPQGRTDGRAFAQTVQHRGRRARQIRPFPLKRRGFRASARTARQAKLCLSNALHLNRPQI